MSQRRADEAVRAKELVSSGHLLRLWRPVGELRSIGVWRADDEADLYKSVLGTLPLWPRMTALVTVRLLIHRPADQQALSHRGPQACRRPVAHRSLAGVEGGLMSRPAPAA
ncbi:muconolactone Delta-isomerase family protein [Streptomyces sp. NBC_00365]|nr:muconolactone Delta-isomerase family protein [Streptomyces sp. NBC_00365]MCX5097370.1 muconolactone Delta-isomerase family protein [Streptomyces sp. NBC_00365]